MTESVSKILCINNITSKITPQISFFDEDDRIYYNEPPLPTDDEKINLKLKWVPKYTGGAISKGETVYYKNSETSGFKAIIKDISFSNAAIDTPKYSIEYINKNLNKIDILNNISANILSPSGELKYNTPGR